MVLKNNIFKVECKKDGSGNCFHFINIKKIDSKLSTLIDKNIVQICEGKTDTNLPVIKQRLIDFLIRKNDSYIVMGAIAEFFTHLYLNEIGFKQEFLFLNLEEGSIKKGFDGYYSHSKEEWIYESKSGNISTKGISHQGKIREAYNDLKKTIAGKKKNNPWQNAYSHASQIDVDTDLTIRQNIKSLSNDFVMGKYHDIKKFNIIPGSTIFLEGKWESLDSSKIEKKLTKLVKKFEFKKIQIVCFNTKSIDLFWDYLKG